MTKVETETLGDTLAKAEGIVAILANTLEGAKREKDTNKLA